MSHQLPVEQFIQRWKVSGASERANYQLFLSELCDVLGVARPDPTGPDESQNQYVFEKAVTFKHSDGTTSNGRIDLYRRGCFVLEAKQGVSPGHAHLLVPPPPSKQKRVGHGQRGTATWDHALVAARGQAEQYARALPASEGWPPFLIIVDVGHCIELYADFSLQGKAYLQFPNAQGFRIPLEDLESQQQRELLRTVWTDPLSLDPSRRAAKVTREVAEHMAVLARSFEGAGHAPGTVASFLMKCLFTMFAEDVDLIPANSFSEILARLRGNASKSVIMLRMLWESMDKGGFSPLLATNVLRFNGSLFADPDALPLGEEQLDLLVAASRTDWRDVEPAIFGTLLERALDPKERHKLGAHYTPRAYVERLVMPTIIEPLRQEWNDVRIAAVALAGQGNLDGASKEVDLFHRRLCGIRVLDPACGSGNFLYVTMEHMKRLEGEVLDTLRQLGQGRGLFEESANVGFSVMPEQFLGIEANPMAAAVARVVLWIGYLQWHFRTRGKTNPPEPVLRTGSNIECRDAVLAWDGEPELVLDDNGRPVTRWDGESAKPHPVTGEMVPDETKRIPVYRYRNPRKAEWPKADYIVGNPPFLGNKRMRQGLGEGYAEALREAWADVPDSADYVMYWWHKAAGLVGDGCADRFGLITTNSLPHTSNRKVVQSHIGPGHPMRLLFAVADHPWVDSSDGASVRISMTVGGVQNSPGLLLDLASGGSKDGVVGPSELRSRVGVIQSDLTVGPDVAGAAGLVANIGLSFMGITAVGSGFRVETSDGLLNGLLSSGRKPSCLRPFLTGRNLARNASPEWIIDFSGLSESEAADCSPECFQRVIETVRPERLQNGRAAYRDRWWVFGEPRPAMRRALKGLSRFIVTLETSRYRYFVFVDDSILADHSLFVVASEDAYVLGILGSRLHTVWTRAAGSRLGAGNDTRWRNKTCFEPFPFPESSEGAMSRISVVAEKLDALRKRQISQYTDLTLTGIYSVMEKLRSGEPLTAKEKLVNEQGLCSVLKQIHDDLDAAVFEAYGWPTTLTDEEILERLVALNNERAAEEAKGLVRWLRPEFQNPQAAVALDKAEAKQAQLFPMPEGGAEEPEEEAEEADSSAGPTSPTGQSARLPWPESMPGQVQAVRSLLASAASPLSVAELAGRFQGRKASHVVDIVATLVLLGQAREVEGGYLG